MPTGIHYCSFVGRLLITFYKTMPLYNTCITVEWPKAMKPPLVMSNFSVSCTVNVICSISYCKKKDKLAAPEGKNQWIWSDLVGNLITLSMFHVSFYRPLKVWLNFSTPDRCGGANPAIALSQVCMEFLLIYTLIRHSLDYNFYTVCNYILVFMITDFLYSGAFLR